MNILSLPNELLFCIADNLEYTWEINRLCRANKRLYDLLKPWLYRFDRQYTRTSTLLRGAGYGFAPIIRKLLEDDAFLKSISEKEWGGLISGSASRGQIECLKLLLEAEKQLQPSIEWKQTFSSLLFDGLGWAASNGHVSTVQLLLEYGAPIFQDTTFCVRTLRHMPVANMAMDWIRQSNRFTDTQRLANTLYTVLDCTIRLYHYRPSDDCVRLIVQGFLEMGVDPNSQDTRDEAERYRFNPDTGCGFIYYPAMNGFSKTVQCLLEHGADASPKMDDGSRLRPLCFAVEWCNIRLARLMLKSVDTEEIISDGKETGPLLCVAAACGLQTLVRELLYGGYQAEEAQENQIEWAEEYDQQKALDWASKFGHGGVVRLLLNHGVKPSLETLGTAVRHRSVRITKMLLDANADAACFPDGYILHDDCPALGPSLFELLLNQHAEQNPGYASDLSRLMQKVLRSGHIPQAQMLLDRGFRLGAILKDNPDDNGGIMQSLDILEFAAYGGVAALEFLFDNGFEYPQKDTIDNLSPIMIAATNWDFDALRFLLEKGVRVPRDDELVHTLMSIFRKYDAEQAQELCDLLISYGAEFNFTGEVGTDALFSAIIYRSEEALKFFLNHGADPLSRDEFDGEPLGTALRWCYTRGVQIMLDTMHDPPLDRLRKEVLGLKSKAALERQWNKVGDFYCFEVRNGFHLLPTPDPNSIPKPYRRWPEPPGGVDYAALERSRMILGMDWW
ncbi:uncharacterized protein APUU_21474S [Aspergillus puulaauensis]|uniref:F-box domain-containing protein n=1 Tax=Aspergillus puulaauensis TaxID=1220207 RepID=A0A7R8AJW2_9EURO|nr:uncharacterized protein APUU_21474S [Aspergillus puulaauensis]BCS21042.1 hypothetical protein APUU_21474S [Aspergillus puulaauensis]